MKHSENYMYRAVTDSEIYALSNGDDDVSIDAFNDCPALTGFFFDFIKMQVVEAVEEMSPGETCEIASLLDVFLWDYFGEQGRKAAFRCIDCLILEGLPLIRAHAKDKEYPRFVRAI